MSGTEAYGDDDLLALSGLQHLAYCERQWALIHLEQIWTESADTLRGEFFHERVDARGYTNAGDARSERSVRLVGRKLGLYGVADIVEYDRQDTNRPLWPVEYKVGRPKVEDWDCVQLAAQVLCLEEMYEVSIEKAVLFYGKTRRREWVEVGGDLRQRVVDLARRAHELASEALTPTAEFSARCRRCSLIDECAPSALNKNVKAYWENCGEPLEVRQ
jgi:CRISPR-associated exonuclease Cas4